MPLTRNDSRARPARLAAIHLTRRFDASAQRVFDAWLDPALAGRWLFATATQPMTHVLIEARVGGRFRLAHRHDGVAAEHRGRFVEIVPHRRLVFEHVDAEHPGVTARVAIEIAPRRRGCALRLTSENLPADDAQYAEARWDGILYGLHETLRSDRLSFPRRREPMRR
jgi:uncharacterized protein YndB with AHSA1/START domain